MHWGQLWDLCECQAEFGYMLALEHSNSKIYSEAAYFQKNDTYIFLYFCQKLFCCIKPYTLPVLLVIFKIFACSILKSW